MIIANLAIRRNKMATLAVVGVGAVLAVGACSSKPATAPTNPPTVVPPTVVPAPAPAGAVPAPPTGSTAVSGGGTNTNYKNTMAPAAVKNYYVTALQASGYTIITNTQNGGGGGGYGGSGAGVIASQGATFVGVGAGGETGQTTYFSVCSGPTQAAVQGCYSNENNNSNSGQS